MPVIVYTQFTRLKPLSHSDLLEGRVCMCCMSGFRLSGSLYGCLRKPLTTLTAWSSQSLNLWLTMPYARCWDHEAFHLQMTGTSPCGWSGIVGSALHWLVWALHRTPGKLIQNVPKLVFSMPPLISLLESLWMLPALGWCTSVAVLNSNVWLNGSGVAKTGLQVQTVYCTWFQGQKEMPCFAYDMPGLCKFVSS